MEMVNPKGVGGNDRESRKRAIGLDIGGKQ